LTTCSNPHQRDTLILMKNKFYILLLLFLTSCSAYKNKGVSGYYQTKGGFEWGSSISLSSDSTFSYKWQIGLFVGVTKGKWDVEYDSIILNSDLQPPKDKTPDYYLIDRGIVDSEDIIFELFLSDTTEVLIGANGLMFKNDDTIAKALSDNEGKMLFARQDFDSIKISYLGIKYVNVVDKECNYFKIIALEDSSSYMYEYFTDEKWKIHKNVLIDDTENEYYYEKKMYRTKVKNQKPARRKRK